MAMQRDAVSTGVAALYREIRSVLEQARASAYRAVNFAMVQAYWQVGRLIVEHEQKGKSRAAYGEAVFASLAERLTRDLGRGFDERNLWYMRSFFLAPLILNAPRSELPSPKKRAAVRAESATRIQHAVGHTLPAQGIRDAVRHKSTVTDSRRENADGSRTSQD